MQTIKIPLEYNLINSLEVLATILPRGEIYIGDYKIYIGKGLIEQCSFPSDSFMYAKFRLTLKGRWILFLAKKRSYHYCSEIEI